MQYKQYLTVLFNLDNCLYINSKYNIYFSCNKKKQASDISNLDMSARSSHLSINNKLLLYKTVIAPIWTYGPELWGCASKSNIAIIQKFQSKLLRAIVNAPWYINAMIHSDLGIPTVQDVIHDRTNKHRAKLQSHPNPLVQIISRDDIPRRLKRR